MIAPLDLLRYWRASLADGQLPSLPSKVPMRDVEWDAIRSGRVSPEVARTLVGDWRASGNATAKGNRTGDKGDPVSVPVLIAPLVFIARHQHGNSGRKSDKPYAPLIMPAQMAADGRLTFDPAKHQPWLWRGALEPTAATEPPLGSLDDFDAFRSSVPRPEDSAWGRLIEYTEALCKAVTGSALADVMIDGYDRGPAMLLAAFPPSSPSKNLITLADALVADEDNLPPTFVSACRSGPMRPQLDGSARWEASTRHYGQMGADFPLADRQRDAVHHLCFSQNGDVLPVNGPPGTGKTTLIQSIIATMVVDAALAGGEPPVIVVTSTNNQAVTNVIDSFAKVKVPDHRQNDPLEGRWLPGVTSFALYLPAASKEVDEDKYQVARLPDYGEPLSGMPADMLQSDAVDKAEAAFLAAAETAFGQEFVSVVDAGAELGRRLAANAARLKEIVSLAGGLLSHRAARPDHDAASFAPWVEAEIAAAEDRIATHAQAIASARAEADSAREKWKTTDAAVGRGLEELFPSGGVWGVLLGWLLGFLPSVRAGRWERCRRIVREAGFEDGPFASVQVPTDLDALRQHLDDALAALRQRAEAAERRAGDIEREAGGSASTIRAQMDALKAEAQAWLTAEQQWASVADELCSAAIGIKALKEMSRTDLIARPDCAERVLDVTLRHDLFLLASHYWEARWLHAARALMKNASDPVTAISKKSRRWAEKRWRLMAYLTPCFVSTLFMLPKHLQFYDPAGDNKNPPLTDFVDLLIVDEAGQVPAEIGGIGLALGRKALVVGDIHQIEPVWSVGAHIDDGNLRRYGLLDHADTLDEAGSRASNGSLMKVARNASAFVGMEATDPGIFLTEHRRCLAPIVAICNDLVYANRLIPCTKEPSNRFFLPLGWAHIRSPSGRRGGSRFNAGEAEAIAEWLGRCRGEIEEKYEKKPIHELVGIVTPFSAQKGEIRMALERHGLDERLTVGTVHALQGAEREIVIFSPVHTAEDGGQPFFDRGTNMVNVAVSRARHSFLVFGDMRVFDNSRAARTVPSGVLAQHLFVQPEYEITDVISRPDFVAEGPTSEIDRLKNLEPHRKALREAFEHATSRILVVSPYLSIEAVSRDGVEKLIEAARSRKVGVTIAFDRDLNVKYGYLNPNCADAMRVLTRAGAEVLERDRIHNKTLAVDDSWIVEGSFNWLSAVRDPNHPYARAEYSFRYQGPKAAEFIKDAWSEIEG